MPVVRVSPGPTPTAFSRGSAGLNHDLLKSEVQHGLGRDDGSEDIRSAWLTSRADARTSSPITQPREGSPVDGHQRVSSGKSDCSNMSSRCIKQSVKTTVIRSNRKISPQKPRDAFQKRSKKGISGLIDMSCHTLTPYQKLVKSLSNDESWQRDVTLERRIGFYRFKGEAGTGNFSRVKIGIHCLTKEKVAIKILDKAKLDAKTQRMLSREISSMEKLHHPHLVRLFEVIETFSKVYLVMEYAAAGELYQKITSQGRLSEETAKPLFGQIVSAIDHMHQHHIIHRDIKAENVFFSDAATVKVGDFGFSTKVQTLEELLNTFCGSPPYAAPELFSDESYDGPSVDVWALGVLLYFMVTGTMPFKAQTVASLKRLIIDGEYLMPEFVSSDCSRLIRGLLQHESSRRLAIRDVKECHWLQGLLLPPCLPTYKLSETSCTGIDEQPSAAGSTLQPSAFCLSEEEQEVRRQLQHLGIDEDLLYLNRSDGVRSNVIGTYRILMHRLVTLSPRFGSRVTPAGKSQMHEEPPLDQEAAAKAWKTEASSNSAPAAVTEKSKRKKNSLQAEKRSFVDSEGFFIPQATELFTYPEIHKRKRSVNMTSNNNRQDSNGNTYSLVKSKSKKNWKSRKFVKACILF